MEDVFPIEHRDIPASYVSLPGVAWKKHIDVSVPAISHDVSVPAILHSVFVGREGTTSPNQ